MDNYLTVSNLSVSMITIKNSEAKILLKKKPKIKLFYELIKLWKIRRSRRAGWVSGKQNRAKKYSSPIF